MLETSHANPFRFPVSEPDFSKLIATFVGFVRRRRRILLGSVLVALLVATAYLLAVPSTYIATASIVVVDPQMDPLRQATSQRGNSGPPYESGMVDTQVEILRSDTIALAVMRSLNLRKEPPLVAPLIWAQSLLSSEIPAERREQSVLTQFHKRATIRRVGISNVVQVSYRSNSPSRAAQIANAVVNAYFDDQRNAKVQAGQSASSWLKEQISDLSKQTISVDSILSDGKPRSSPNELSSADQVAALRKAREAARMETAQARAALQSDNGPSPQAQSRYDAARANEAALQTKLNTLIQGSLDESRERAVVGTVEAEALRSAYNGLLQRLMALRYEAFPSVDARIISSASEPTSPSHPQSAFVLAGALFAGLVVGFGGALMVEGLDQTVRSGSQLERTLHLPFLGTLPNLGASRGAWSRNKRLQREAEGRFAETLRNVRFELDLRAPPTTKSVVGFSAASDGQGKRMVATRYASLLKESGHQVAFVTADLRRPSDSNSAETGLWQVLTNRCSLQEAISEDRHGVSFLERGSNLSVPPAADLLSSPKMQNTFQLLKETHDVIVVDLPPLSRVVDLKAVGAWMDSLVLVVEYGVTELEEIRGASEIGLLRGRWAGVLLNNAP